MSSVLVSTSF